MSAKHTQGRLTVAGPTIQGSEDACGVPLALAHMLNPYAGATGAADRVEANARRLVACWNACDGISTERLEDLGRPLLNHLIGCDERAARMVKERDELLVALERAERKLSAYVGVCTGDKELTEAVLPLARAAIAKVKGGAA